MFRSVRKSVAVAVALTLSVVAASASVAATKVIYITSDDGPGPNTRAVLNLLTKHTSQMTFFFTGQHMYANPPLITAVQEQGSVVANHTWSHPYLTELPYRSQIRAELGGTQIMIGAGAGNCYRPPYLNTNANVRRIASEMGLREVWYTINTKDWTGLTPRQIHDAVLSQAKPGAIVLMHADTADRRDSYTALTTILPALKAKGYQIRALSYCRAGAAK